MKNDSIITDLKKPKKKSLARDVWIRLRRNKLAVLGLIVLTLIVLASVFAPLIAPQGIDDQDLKVRFISSAQITMDETSLVVFSMVGVYLCLQA